MEVTHPLQLLSRRLGMCFGPGPAGEWWEALAALPMNIVQFERGSDVLREGDRPDRACIMIKGFTCWSKATAKGRRQILSFSVPGDMPDLTTLHLRRLDSTLTAVSDCTVALVGHNDLRRLCDESSHVTAALWRSTMIDTAIFKEWVLNLGARAAPVRIAHLFCEFIVRLDAVGLVTDGVCDFPLTQAELGDAAGISTVHVNRSLMELRAAGLIELKSGRLKVSNLDALMRAGDFDPTYLHAGD